MTSRFSGESIDLVAEAEALEARIVKGAALLFDMEKAGEQDDRYERWVTNYTRMVEDYDIVTKCIILRGMTSIDAVAPLAPTPDPVRRPEEPDPEQTPLLLGADTPPARSPALVEGF